MYMAEYSNREAFIPYRRADLIDICVSDGQLRPAEREKFRDFCEILSAYYHFDFQKSLEMLKDNYWPFNPDADTLFSTWPTQAQLVQMGKQLVSDLEVVLERANYMRLSKKLLQRALSEKSLVDLGTQVDFDDFEQVICFYRGDSEQSISVKKLFFWQEERTIKIFERVVLLLKFKDADYFVDKKINIENLNFTPGKMYVYLYKNIPQRNIELLFPNVEISMTLKDRLLFGVPAIGGAALIFMKALLVAFGGFAFRQYTNYKNKRIRFQQKVTETLFFSNLDSNAGVFQTLIDAAEEEECKKIILVYYHLLTSHDSLTQGELDDKIESWMEDKFDIKIDFDIQGPLRNLEAIRGTYVTDDNVVQEGPLLTYDSQGCCQVLPLDEAKSVLDDVWDNVFSYANR